jgi:hypothetical protein
MDSVSPKVPEQQHPCKGPDLVDDAWSLIGRWGEEAHSPDTHIRRHAVDGRIKACGWLRGETDRLLKPAWFRGTLGVQSL